MEKPRIFSVFVNNLPHDVDAKWLFEIFERCGEIAEAFIPFKLNKGGRRFGFIKFFEKGSAIDAVNSFNGVWLLRHRLGVNLARFERAFVPCKDFGGLEEVNPVVVSPKANLQGLDASISGGGSGRSFADVLLGKQSGPSKRETSHPIDSFKSCLGSVNGAIVEMLKNSLVGISLKRVEGSFLKECFIREGVLDIEIRSISDRVFLLKFEDSDVLKSMEEDGWLWLRSWFIYIEHWNDKFLVPSRCSWLQCTGVPLTVWSMETFSNIGGLWGKCISVAPETSKFKQFQNGYILVAIDAEERVDDCIEVDVKGRGYRVKIKELDGDPIWTLDDSPSKSKSIDFEPNSSAVRGVELSVGRFNNDTIGCDGVLGVSSVDDYHMEDSVSRKGLWDPHAESTVKSPTPLVVPETPTSVLKGGECENVFRNSNVDAVGSCSDCKEVLSDSEESEWETDDELEVGNPLEIHNQIEETRLKKRIGKTKALDLIFDSCGEGIRWKSSFKPKVHYPAKIIKNKENGVSFEEACSLLEAGTVGSISDGGIRNCNENILGEVLESWKPGKVLGFRVDGDEGKIVSRLQELEERDWSEFERCHTGS